MVSKKFPALARLNAKAVPTAIASPMAEAIKLAPRLPEREVAERDELIGFPERDEEQWRQYFNEFEEKVWPMFRERGFTFQSAFACWSDYKTHTYLDRIEDRLIEALADDSDDDGDIPSVR